jgi:hypothetical protein
MQVERSDIELVMKNFGCDEDTALSFIDGGINLQMLREGLDDIVESELNLSKDIESVKERLTEAVGEFQQDA